MFLSKEFGFEKQKEISKNIWLMVIKQNGLPDVRTIHFI